MYQRKGTYIHKTLRMITVILTHKAEIFELTNSEDEKDCNVLTLMYVKSNVLTGDGSEYSGKGICNSKNHNRL